MIMIALVLVASASLFTASAANKKEKKTKVTPVTLASVSDSLSYASGVYATRGLIPFIQQSYKVDTAYMADFIRGYEELSARLILLRHCLHHWYADSPDGGTAYLARYS